MLYAGTLQEKKDRPNYYIVLGSYVDGKRKQKWISTDIPIKGNNKRKADLKLKEVLNEYNTEGVEIHSDKNILFIEYVQQWLESIKPTIASSTHDGYSIIVNTHIVPYFKGKSLKVKDIAPSHIEAYIKEKQKTVSNNTVNKHLINLSQCFKKALRDNIIPFNPVERVNKPKHKQFKDATFYNEQQIIGLLDIIKGDCLETLILFTLFYGLRRSEVLGLKWGAINFIDKSFVIQHTVVKIGNTLYKLDTTKTDSSHRTFPLADMLLKRLLELKEQQDEYKHLQPKDYTDEGYVFTYVEGKVLNPNYVTTHFKRLLTNHGFPIIRFHDLRHSSASFLLYLGFNFKEIQAWLGHGNIGTTMNVYAHLDMTAKENMSNTLNAKFESFSI